MAERSELQLIEQIRRRAAIIGAPSIILGIGDDCAVYRPPGAPEDLLFTTDMLVEGTHFRRETHRPEDVGWKTLARGLSDIAAMGGSPRFCLLSLCLAPWANDRWVEKFFTGFALLAARENAALVGGDLARGEKLTCDIVVAGAVPAGAALRRSGA